MSGINAAQEQEVSFVTGVTAQQTVASQSFWTWNGNDPASYAGTSTEAKWGPAAAGTGASVSVAFDAASNWSTTEVAAFQAAMHLWSEVANITFTVVGGSNANLVISRAHDGSAETSSRYYGGGGVGSTELGTLVHAGIAIDTSVAGFGPIGAGFAVDGGYPWLTIVHELGHAIGLGHSGAYDEGQTTNTPMLTSYDTTAWSVMSYVAGDDYSEAGSAATGFSWGHAPDGSPFGPLTPMPLDILAAQRLYGLPTNTPLSGGQVFGFHSNLQGDTAQFFDFTIDRAPVVTLWDAGGNNTLDLSGYATGNTVSLTDGTFSSVGGHNDNVAIAYGTRIDAVIGGTGTDTVSGNDDGDVIQGNAGSDVLTGGAGNDHIYGNLATTGQGAADGDDQIDTGGGTNYVNGNAGNDLIKVHGDANRIYGGAGNDSIEVSSGVNHINGNTGNDTILITSYGESFVSGGQGDDYIIGQAGNNVLSGDRGDDIIIAGSGVNVITGGDGRDRFEFGTDSSPLNRGGALAGYHDEITDFTPGTDVIYLTSFLASTSVVLHADDQQFGSVGSAASYAQGMLNGAATGSIAVLQVGSDSYLFYDGMGNSPVVDSAIKLDNIAAAQIHASDFGA